jgi:pyruvate,water dikinase
MYEMVLGVPPGDILDAYRRVLASLFSEQALRYRAHHAPGGEEPAMAVGVMRMVDARVSGGLYTYAPLRDQDRAMVVSAAWGLGKPIVEGTAETDTYLLDREPPHELLSSDIAAKTTRMALVPSGGTDVRGVPDAKQAVPCLTPDQLAVLARTAMALERFFKRPLDVEWAFTGDDALVVLQARPLAIRPRESSRRPDAAQRPGTPRCCFPAGAWRPWAAWPRVRSTWWTRGRICRTSPTARSWWPCIPLPGTPG